MITLKELDELACKWNRTKNPKYKEEWYKLVKKFNEIHCNNTPVKYERPRENRT